VLRVQCLLSRSRTPHARYSVRPVPNPFGAKTREALVLFKIVPDDFSRPPLYVLQIVFSIAFKKEDNCWLLIANFSCARLRYLCGLCNVSLVQRTVFVKFLWRRVLINHPQVVSRVFRLRCDGH